MGGFYFFYIYLIVNVLRLLCAYSAPRSSCCLRLASAAVEAVLPVPRKGAFQGFFAYWIFVIKKYHSFSGGYDARCK